jgi:UDP-N-acetylglucosamine 1-carboxyvinyltransferase
MDVLRITGGRPLFGAVGVAGAKNATLPIMAASILADGPVRLSGVPRLADVATLGRLLGRLGVRVDRASDGCVVLNTVEAEQVRADHDLVRRMRAGFCVLGPLLARRGRAVVSLPGGCCTWRDWRRWERTYGFGTDT